LHDAYKNNHIGGVHINQKSRQFHKLMFYVTYGIEHGFLNWDEIPYISELTQDFATKDGVSFAFMELPKFTNAKEYFAINIPLVNNFIGISKNVHRNFWNEQIKNLDPDIIITMKLQGFLDTLGKITIIDDKKYPREYLLDVGKNHIKLIDTCHFSDWRKNQNEYFYKPIIDIVEKCMESH
jgi:hypothetical protein